MADSRVLPLFTRGRRPKPGGAGGAVDVFHVEMDGRAVPVRARRNARAKRLILRVQPCGTAARVTVPPGVSQRAVQRFLDQHVAWLRARLTPVSPEAGAPSIPTLPETIPLRGIHHALVVQADDKGLVRLSHDAERGPSILLPGDPPHAPAKLRRYLQRAARSDLTVAVKRHIAVLGTRATALSVRDTTSRWGSCSARGGLSFSWRLVLAPPHVLDYVAAHEVAHLQELNHSPRFWALVERLDPNYRAAERWLKTHGASLHRVLPKG